MLRPVRATGLPYRTYKGFTVAAPSPDDLFRSGSALRAIARVGANTATLVVTWYAPSARSADIVAMGGTVSDAALVWATRYARSLGLAVVLKPHLDSEDGQWRAYINPRDAGRWFAQEFPRVPFWDALDYLGISAYFAVVTAGAASEDAVRAAWIGWRDTEVGYRSASGSAQHPFLYADGPPLDTREQVACYAGVFEAWATIPWRARALFWEWSIRGAGAADTGYDVAHEPVEAVVSAWFHGRGGAAPLPLPASQLRAIVTANPPTLSGTRVVQGGSLTG